MTRDQFRKQFYSNKKFKRIKDDKLFTVESVIPLEHEHIFLVKFRSMNKPAPGRIRYKDLISFCKTYKPV